MEYLFNTKAKFTCLLMVMLVFSCFIQHHVYGQMVGCSIKNDDYNFSTKTIVPEYGNVRVTTSCAASSKSNVSGVVWYNTNVADNTVGSCNKKLFPSVMASKGKTFTTKIKLNKNTCHLAMGIYAGGCVSRYSAYSSSGNGSTLASVVK